MIQLGPYVINYLYNDETFSVSLPFKVKDLNRQKLNCNQVNNVAYEVNRTR